jgi:hypothetical protein
MPEIIMGINGRTRNDLIFVPGMDLPIKEKNGFLKGKGMSKKNAKPIKDIYGYVKLMNTC